MSFFDKKNLQILTVWSYYKIFVIDGIVVLSVRKDENYNEKYGHLIHYIM